MYNEAQKKATMKYLDKLKEIRFRVQPEEYEKEVIALKIAILIDGGFYRKRASFA